MSEEPTSDWIPVDSGNSRTSRNVAVTVEDSKDEEVIMEAAYRIATEVSVRQTQSSYCCLYLQLSPKQALVTSRLRSSSPTTKALFTMFSPLPA